MNVSSHAKAFSMSSDQTAETLAIVGEVLVLGGLYQFLTLELSSAGGSAVALDQFEVQVKAHPDAAWETLLSSGYDTQSDHVAVPAGNTLNTLAHGSAETCVLRLGPFYAVRLMSAQAGVTASAVTVTARGLLSIHGIQGNLGVVPAA